MNAYRRVDECSAPVKASWAVSAVTDLALVRTEIVAAVADDPVLRELLILKGGNALALVHKIGMRSSLDIDYSMTDDLDDPDGLAEVLESALCARFARHSLAVFDFSFAPRPRTTAPASRTWGGYNAEFKLIDQAAGLEDDVEQMRREALTVDGDPQASRRFRIEISKFEFCGDQAEVPIGDGIVCRVYSLDLVAAEKLRSLCQQMDGYGKRRHSTPRSRDFYDLHALVTEGAVDFGHPDLHTLVRASFVQKEVPLKLLDALRECVTFHEQDWLQVLNSIPAHKPREFGFYADFVLAEVRKLQPVWDVDPP